jgi:hypothetical protein
MVGESQNLCIDGKLVDTDPATPAIEPDCRVFYRVPTVDSKTQRAGYEDLAPPLSLCPPGTTSGNVATECWQWLVDPTRCPGSGLRIGILRSATAINAGPFTDGVQIVARCWTCPALTSAVGCAY